jgi:hypothetical protein
MCLLFREFGDKCLGCREQICREIGNSLLLPLGLLALRLGCGRLFNFSETGAALLGCADQTVLTSGSGYCRVRPGDSGDQPHRLGSVTRDDFLRN